MNEADSLTDALVSQVALYKGEYENLKLETKTLIDENTTMSKRIDELLSKKCEHDDEHSTWETNEGIIEGLRKKLAVTMKEKESYESLWKTSQNTIQSLENELKTYQNYHKNTSIYVNADEVKREYSSMIKVLESKLSLALRELDLKADNIKILSNDKDDLSKCIVEKEKNIQDLIRKESDNNMKIENLDKEISCLKTELATYKRNVEEITNNMELNRQSMDAYAKKEFESRQKVFEALRLVDSAITERDSALEREKIAIDEKSRISHQLTESLKESTLRVQKEIDIVKQSYNEKLNDMLVHIQRLELELSEKELSIERVLRECALLEERTQSLRKHTTIDDDEKENKILTLEQKLEATFQQLVLSERRNIQIASEKENLQMDYDQLTNGFRRDKKKREWEEKLYSNEINSLRVQITNLKDTLDEAHKTIQDLQADVIFKESLEEKLAIDKMSLTKEFEKHFETQRKLNSRWKESMKEIINKLESTIENLLEENKLLKEENYRLIQNSVS